MQTITVIYGGEDTRSLSYQSESPVTIGGDNNSTTLHFSFPEGYTNYTKYVLFDIKLLDADGNLVYAEYELDNNDSILLPLELTQAGRGRTHKFKLKITDTNYTELSKYLGIKFER